MRVKEIEKIAKRFTDILNTYKKAETLLSVLATLGQRDDVVLNYLFPFDPIVSIERGNNVLDFAAIFVPVTSPREIEGIVRKKLETAIRALEDAGLTVMVKPPERLEEIYAYVGINLK